MNTNDFFTESHQKVHYDIIRYVQNIVLVFWYVVGTAVINKMLKICDDIPYREFLLFELNINVQENSMFSSQLVVAAGAAVASHPYVRVRLFISLKWFSNVPLTSLRRVPQ